MSDVAHESAKLAVEERAARVTIPIMYWNGETHEIVGTGTCLRINERLFVVTAAHLFAGYDLGLFCIPVARANAQPVRLLGKLVRSKDAVSIDIAVIEIVDATVRGQLLAGWDAITLEDVGDADDQGVFVLSGYPSTQPSERNATMEYGLTTTFTERLDRPPDRTKDPIDESIDLFFLHSDHAIDRDGKLVATDPLQGASGASVWQYREDVSGLWTARKAMKVVGVQSSAASGAWFRAKSWGLVRLAISQLASS